MPHKHRSVDAALVRVAANLVTGSLPPWPDVTGDTIGHVQQWRDWLGHVWKQDSVAEAIEVASPVLAGRVKSICEGADLPVRDMRRVVLSTARYVLRMTGRATPFGLFAGVAPIQFGSTSEVRWGGRDRVIAHADAVWLGTMISGLETHRDLLRRLSVVANNMCVVRGDRLVLLRQQTGLEPPGVASEVSIRRTRPVEIALAAARSSISFTDLISILAAQPDQTPRPVERMLAELVVLGVLFTSLRPPMTVSDGLGYVVDHLTTVNADSIPELADQIQELRAIHSAVKRHNGEHSPSVRQQARAQAVRRMSALCGRVEQPLVVDMRVDGKLVLPEKIAWEAERAASVLLRLTSRPFGASAWRAYHARFLDRYGVGGLVPVIDLVNEDTGLGFPAGYRGSLLTPSPASLAARDHRLLKLAQHAVMDCSDEVILDDRTIDEIAADAQMNARMPPHFELCFQIHSLTRQALDRGEFQIAVVSASRAAGTTTGRFLHLLDTADRDRMADLYAGLPTAEAGAWRIQISCPPLSRRTDNVGRVAAVLPDIVSLGEYPSPGSSLLPLEDLVVSADAQRLYLMSLSRQRIVEPTFLHAVEFRNHTHPLARFLGEITTAQAAACLPFSWGAASTLPFLPGVRYGRVILASARWNIDASDLPPQEAPWSRWSQAFSELRDRLRIPDIVVLGEDDRRLRLDLSVSLHRVILRSQLERMGRAILHEAPDPGAFGWSDGRPHEVVLPLARTTPVLRSSRPTWVLHTLGRDHGHLPGASEWLLVKLYGSPTRQTAVLTTHLPHLLETWDDPPEWWYVRYRDPEPHLRLRLRLSDSDAETLGVAVQRVGTWARDLRRAGLVTRLQFDTHFPETGRFGTGVAMEAAESVFVADSVAAVEELRYAAGGVVHPQVLLAVSLADIAVGFHGSVRQAMLWLINEVEGSRPAPRREIHAQARRLADPDQGWATLGSTPGGDLIEAAWRTRRAMLAAYRGRMSQVCDVDPAFVLPSLLHLHHLRVMGSEPESEQICQRLARAVALSWRAQTGKVIL